MQLSAAVGINRILVLAHLIETPLMRETNDHGENDHTHIDHRQVPETKYQTEN